MKHLIFAVGLLFTLQSCNKCSECHYEDVNDSEVEIGEYCGDDLEAIEKSGFFVATEDTTYTVHCNEH